jgi:outer membrane immunogenic protein
MSDVSPSCAPGLKEQSTAFIRAMCGQAAAAFSQQAARFVRRPIIASEPTPGAPTNGVIGGVLAGYNWQSGPLVLGIEANIGWTNAVGHGTAVIIITTTTTTPNTYKLHWASNFVGKAGYAVGQWLFFATGGLGVADLTFIEGITTTTFTPQPSGGKYVGFSVGGGVEYAFTRNLLGRLQYIYDDFGGKTYVAADGGIYRVSLTSQTLRGALSWKF